MSFFESILYGFISGIAEFLPVSARGHQVLMRYIFGVGDANALQELILHIGLLAAIVLSNWDLISALRLENRKREHTRRKGSFTIRSNAYYDLRLLKTATAPLVIGLVLTAVTAGLNRNLLNIMAFLILNAAVLLVADHTSRGNRDARTMTGLDGIVMGVLGAVSVLPGVSRTGMIASYTAARGADPNRVVDWSVLLGLPALALLVVFDFVGLFTVGAGLISFLTLLNFVACGITAFCGGYLGIKLLRAVLNYSGFSGFAYYSIGAALFTFVLYLIT